MNKKKIISTLVLALVLTSTSIGTINTTAFAQETSASILEKGVGQAQVPILQNSYKDPSYYNNGLPDNIEIEKRDFNTESVILDVKFNSISYIGNNFILLSNTNGELSEFLEMFKFMTIPIRPEGKDDFLAKFYNVFTKIDLSSLRPKGYIRRDNKVVQNFSEIIDGMSSEHLEDQKNPSVVPKGEVAFSIILDRNSPLISDMKVERTTGFEKLTSSFITPNQEARLEYHTSTGVSNEEAFSIAKTVGTSFTMGFSVGGEAPAGGGKGSLSANMSYTVQNSLTKTFSSSYSVTSSENVGGTHVFSSKDGLSHRVGIYKYYEKYKSKPTFNQTLKNQYPFLYPVSETKMNIKNIQSLDISSDDQLKNMISVREQSFDGLQPEIISFKQLTGQAPTYDSQNKVFKVQDSTFDLVVNVQDEGQYNLGWFHKENILNTGYVYANVPGGYESLAGSVILLNRGMNTIRVAVKGACNIETLQFIKAPYK